MAAARALTIEEVKEMIQTRAFRTMGPYARNAAMLVLQFGCGPRINELLALTVGNLIDRNGRLKSCVSFGSSKHSNAREVVIPPPVMPFLVQWMAELEGMGLLFREMPLFPARASLKPLSRKQAYKIYSAAAKELDLKNVSTHSPRKSWAISCYRILSDQRAAGGRVEPLLETQKLGGWKKVDSVMHYLSSNSHWGKFVQANMFKGGEF